MSQSDDIAIVGGGQSGKHLLLGLAHAMVSGRLPKQVHIAIYEEEGECGPGWAWSPNNVDPIHLSSLPNAVCRAQVGRDEITRFAAVVDYLRGLGATVTVHDKTHVVAIERGRSVWGVVDAAGEIRLARHVVLAIGHSAFATRQPDCVPALSPWPFAALTQRVAERVVDGQANVLVLGSYLTAIDVITGLAAWAQTQDIALHFTVLSRSGELPKVWGGEPPPPDNASAAQAKMAMASGSFGFDAFEQLVLDAVPGSTNGALINSRPASLEGWLQALCSGESQSRLKADINEVQSRTWLGWQRVLFGSLPLLSESYAHFTDADKYRFLRLRSRYYRAAMPMAQSNAKRLGKLFDAGLLSVSAAPDGYQLTYDPQQGITTIDQPRGIKSAFHAVVWAGGPDRSLERSPSPLLSSLHKQGLVQPCVLRHGNSLVELGGVDVNPMTCEVRSPEVSRGTQRLFAMGPLVIGSFPDAQSVGHIIRDTGRIVSQFVRLNTEQSNEFTSPSKAEKTAAPDTVSLGDN